VFISGRPSRYGLISNNVIRTIMRVSLVFALVATIIGPSAAIAQGVPSWWGSPAWFDWSDYRGTLGAKLFLANLTSGTVTKEANPPLVLQPVTYDLVGGLYGITNTLEPVVEFWAELYIDRLAFRGAVDVHNFVGRSDDPTDQRLTRLDADFSRIELNLDVIRYPFLKLGINTDYYVSPVKFWDRSDNQAAAAAAGIPTGERPYQSRQEPWTLGVYGQAIPVRLRDVPVIAHARFRFPMPFMSSNMPRITDWEIGAGFRPAIWDTSMFAHSAFSVAIEAGYRSTNLDMSAIAVDFALVPDLQLKARWQGAFFQVEAFF
jgi:hypothetical protein